MATTIGMDVTRAFTDVAAGLGILDGEEWMLQNSDASATIYIIQQAAAPEPGDVIFPHIWRAGAWIAFKKEPNETMWAWTSGPSAKISTSWKV